MAVAARQAHGMRVGAAPRWAVSFADLGLLLLGCFVMLHAMQSAPSTPQPSAAREQDAGTLISAGELFEPGEARLTDAGRERLREVAHGYREGARLVSRGAGEGGARLDRFELSAARTTAVARMLAEGGLPQENVAISLDASGAGEAQTIRIVRE